MRAGRIAGKMAIKAFAPRRQNTSGAGVSAVPPTPHRPASMHRLTRAVRGAMMGKRGNDRWNRSCPALAALDAWGAAYAIESGVRDA